MGDSGYDRGARQQQIRDRLLGLEKATEADMLSVQLDDRAVFLEPWQKLLIQVLSAMKRSKDNPQRAQVRETCKPMECAGVCGFRWLSLCVELRNSVINQLSDLIGAKL